MDDDIRLANNIAYFFKKNGLVVETINTGKQGLNSALNEEYDVIVLDWMLGDIDGPQICQQVRAAQITTPIIFLTSRAQVEDKVQALELGADDYLTKPFSLQELLARVKALIRRTDKSNPVQSIIKIKNIEIDTNKCQVKVDQKLVELSPKLYGLLEYMARNQCQVLTRNDIIAHVWDQNAELFTNNIDVHIKNLRKSLKDKDNQIVKTIRGKGYMLCPE